MLQTLLWLDEIRPAILEGLDQEAKVRPQEIKMAASLIETMAADFEPDKYDDDYQIQLKELIEAKAAGGEAFTAPERETSSDDGDDEVADLLAALRASVEDRGGKADDQSDDDDDDEDSDSKKPAKKSTATKAPARTSATKKAPAKKAAASKSSTARKTPAKKTPAKKAPAKKSA